MNSKLLPLLGALCVAVLAGLVADALTTVALFVVLVPLSVGFAVIYGLHMAMLSDGYPKSRVSHLAILGAMAGPVLGTLASNIAAVFVALAITGPTFYIPLAAAAASVLFAIGTTGLAVFLIGVFR